MFFFFWEIKHPGLADTAFAYYDSDPPTISCAGNSFNIPAQSNGPYNFNLNLSNNSCVKVEVVKENKGTYIETTIKSKGYNMLDCDSTSSFKFERAIKMTIFKTLE